MCLLGSIMSKYCTSPTFLLGFAPWIQHTVKHLGTCKQLWHFHPEGLLTLNISTDRCRFLMPTNHLSHILESWRCSQEVYLSHVQVTRPGPIKSIKGKSELRNHTQTKSHPIPNAQIMYTESKRDTRLCIPTEVINVERFGH